MSISSLRVEWASRSAMLQLTDDQGRKLYTVTSGGNIRRTRKVSKATRKRVLDRDGHACVWCGSSEFVELDHIVRYADGGSDDENNLRVLCKPCHDTRLRGDR